MKEISIIIVLLCLHSEAFTAGEKSVTGGCSAALGGISVTESDLWSVRNNQAGLAWLNKTAAGFSLENRFLLAGITSGSLAIAVPFGFGTAGISVSRYGNELYREFRVGMAFARKFGKRFSGAVELYYLNIGLPGEYGSKRLGSCALGVQYHPPGSLEFGIHLSNPVPLLYIDDPHEYLPMTLSFGIAWICSKELRLMSEIEKDNLNPPVFRAGAEYSFAKHLVARTGFSTNPFTFSFGFGLETGRLTIDFASGYHQVLGFSPALSIIYIWK